VSDERALPRGWPDGFGVEGDERRALLALATLRGTDPRAVHALAWRTGSARGCLARIRGGHAGSDGDREHLQDLDVDAVQEAMAACGARLVGPDDDEYPACLLDLHDPPSALFVRGRSLREDHDRVSIVGSRGASALGAEVAHDLGRCLSGAGVWVVSGAARGIDSASHRGALAAGGRTVAVLGSGIDVLYPRGSAPLLARILEEGTIVSEYAPGVPAEPFRFPARNRLVAGLGRALVVVEGAERSGSMISVDHALELGRDVFAVPGPVTSELSTVPLALIREGATLIRGAEDLLHDLGIAARLTERPPPDLAEADRRVWEALAGPALPDSVARMADLSIPDVMSALLRLEIRGLVRAIGGRYQRCLVPAEVG
jgi:DNA processing protein